MSKRLSVASPPARYLVCALLILSLGGCQTTGIEDITRALGGKADPAVGAGRRSRSARSKRGGAAILRRHTDNRAGRTVGAVQSRTVLHAAEQPAAGRGSDAPRARAQSRRSPGARQSRARAGTGRKAGR